MPGPAGQAEVIIPEPAGLVAEEDRSRRPTVFSALREIIAAFAGDDPHLGLYGAFGYDLAFQFEPVRLRAARPASQRDLVLHLPDELYVLDRKREFAAVYRYEFEAGGAQHGGAVPGYAPRAGPRRCGGHWRSAGWGPAGAGAVRAHRAAGQGAVRAG